MPPHGTGLDNQPLPTEAPPEEIWPLLVDVHCHPTDDPSPWSSVEALASKIRQVRLGSIVAMSTSAQDQDLVARLAAGAPDKVIPAFGYHPWFMHRISLNRADDEASAKAHYESLFLLPPSSSPSSSKKAATASEELSRLLPHLPTPHALEDVLAKLQSDLEAQPRALLGEVGIDKAFRLPSSERGWTREPQEPGLLSNPSDSRVESSARDSLATVDEDRGERAHDHSLGLRARSLTSLMVPISHQLTILTAQVELAMRLRRSVSLHSVRAAGATVEWLDGMAKRYPPRRQAQKTNKGRKRKEKQREEQIALQLGEADEEDKEDQERLVFEDINIDLHSCTLSPDTIRNVQRRHPNVYVSFSITINSHQKDLHEQLRACDPRRLLIESDWHSAEGLAERTWAILRLAVDVVGEPLWEGATGRGKEGEGEGEEDKYARAAKRLRDNWQRFLGREDQGGR